MYASNKGFGTPQGHSHTMPAKLWILDLMLSTSGQTCANMGEDLTWHRARLAPNVASLNPGAVHKWPDLHQHSTLDTLDPTSHSTDDLVTSQMCIV